MPYVHGRHNGRAAIVTVSIVDAARYREHKQSNSPILRGVNQYSALIDTGASFTMISSRVSSELNLVPVGTEEVAGLSGNVWVLTYLFHIGFVDASYINRFSNNDGDQHSLEQSADKISRNFICTNAITGGEMQGDPSFDVLLGMDIISTGELQFFKNGNFYFRF